MEMKHLKDFVSSTLDLDDIGMTRKCLPLEALEVVDLTQHWYHLSLHW